MEKNTDEATLLARERTILANQRTYLAWIRTGLASVGGGLAIIRFLTFQNYSHQVASQIIGCVLVVLGIAIFCLSFFDYKKSYSALKVYNGYMGALWSVSIMSFILITVSAVLFLIAFRIA